VTVHRGPAAAELAGALDARAFTHGGEVFLPSSHGPLESGPARSLLAHELTHVVQQRRLGAGLPHESTPHGQALEAEAVAAERSGELPLAPVARGSKHEDEEATSSPPTIAQRAPNLAATSAPGDHATTVVLPPAVQRAPASSAPKQTGKDEPAGRRHLGEQELEDLARQLSARIGRRLRRELLVDRERAGLILDLP
jgi:hypothetical protein